MQKLPQLINDMHEASLHQDAKDFKHWLLAELKTAIDFDFAIWGQGDGQSRELHSAFVFQQTPQLFNTWESVKFEDDYANLVIGNTGQTWSSGQLRKFKQSKAYNEHWRLYQAREMISTMHVEQSTGLHAFLTLVRDQQQKPFSSQEIALKHQITQHAFFATKHNDMHILSRQPVAAALLDSQGLLHALLPNFSELLNLEWRQQGNKLPANVSQALWRYGRYQGREITLQASPCAERLMVQASLRPCCQLSAREQMVAQAYASGQSYKQVAKAMGISPATVRTYLARTYEKTGVANKAELLLWLQQQTL